MIRGRAPPHTSTVDQGLAAHGVNTAARLNTLQREDHMPSLAQIEPVFIQTRIRHCKPCHDVRISTSPAFASKVGVSVVLDALPDCVSSSFAPVGVALADTSSLPNFAFLRCRCCIAETAVSSS